MLNGFAITVFSAVAAVLVTQCCGTTISTSPLQSPITVTTSVVSDVNQTISVSATSSVTSPSNTAGNEEQSEPSTEGTTTEPPTTIPTTPDPCDSAWLPSDELMLACDNEHCATSLLTATEFYHHCKKISNAEETEHPSKRASMGETMAMNIARDIREKVLTSRPVNLSVVIVTDQLAVGSTIITSSLYSNVSSGNFYFPEIADKETKKKLGDLSENAFLYPMTQLPLDLGYTKVAWSMSQAQITKVPESEIEPFRDIVWRLPLSDLKVKNNELIVSKKKPDLRINSAVVTFALEPVPSQPLREPLLLALRRKKSDGMKNHGCYYWVKTTASAGFWSSVGCEVSKNNDTHTECSCTHMSTYALLSEPDIKPDDSPSNAVRAVCFTFCILAIAALAGTIYLTKKTECLDNDRVNLHLSMCSTLMIGYFLFIIGTIKSDVEILNHILSFGLQFAQISPLVWLCLEAVYFLNTIHPFLHDDNMNIQSMYKTYGWAMSAAFAGATCGYDYPHNGQPTTSEFVWLFIDNVKVWTFFGPFLFLIVVNVLLRLIAVVSLAKYTKKSDDDKTPLRIIINILTTTALLVVVVLAWCMGVKAVNNTETKGYHYGFITLYLLQACLVLIFYGWQNEEMWSLHIKRKEQEKKVDEQTVTFTYVP